MKKKRQNRILEIIRDNSIETQEELVRVLNDEGYGVTQATVSRDIRDLKLTKVPSKEGGQKYTFPQPSKEAKKDREKYTRVLRDAFVSMDMAQNILVIHTVAGMGMAVAAAMDELDFSEIVGCIGGDDTIFCAVRTVSDTVALMQKINEIL